MLVLLSPAKTLDLSPVSGGLRPTQPRFKRDFSELLAHCRKLDAASLAKLMKLSPALAELTYERFQAMEPRFTRGNSKAALLAFKGDVYRSLDTASLTPEDLRWAQGHVRIVSGLYGLLRPLDLMQPYRLEMGTRLATDRGRTLYDFWGLRLTRSLNAEHRRRPVPAILDLASAEYSKAVLRETLEPPVVTVRFQERRGGKLKTIGFSAKRARGLMARFVIDNRIEEPDALRRFDLGGYRFEPRLSGDGDLLFVRPQRAA